MYILKHILEQLLFMILSVLNIGTIQIDGSELDEYLKELNEHTKNINMVLSKKDI